MPDDISVPLDGASLQLLDRWIDAQDVSMSRPEAARRLLEDALQKGDPRSTRFTDGERVILAMLAEIHEATTEKGEFRERVMDALWGGHWWSFKWNTSLLHDHVDKVEDVIFVNDVLDMWSFLEERLANLTPEERAKVDDEAAPWGSRAKFNGFDGNNESELIGIARHIMGDGMSWRRFEDHELNSHCPTRSTYGRMLAAWKPIRPRLADRPVSVDELIAVLKAKSWPEDLD